MLPPRTGSVTLAMPVESSVYARDFAGVESFLSFHRESSSTYKLYFEIPVTWTPRSLVVAISGKICKSKLGTSARLESMAAKTENVFVSAEIKIYCQFLL